MEATLEKLIAVLLAGGPQAVVAMLILVIAWLMLERRRLLAEIQRKDDKIDKIVDDYYKGNLTLSEALNSLKMVLFELKAKIG